MSLQTIYEGIENLSVMSMAHRYNTVIFEWLKKRAGRDDRILDFGSGIGEFCNRFIDDGYKAVYSVELDPSLHTFNRCSCVQTIGEHDENFDLIYSCNVLEHIEDDGHAVQELFQALKPGGMIKIFVPANPILYSKMDESVGHFRRYDKKRLIRVTKEAGFEVTDCRYFDFLGFFATLVYKWSGGSGTINQASVSVYDRYIFPLSHFIDKITGGRITGKNLMLIGVKPS